MPSVRVRGNSTYSTLLESSPRSNANVEEGTPLAIRPALSRPRAASLVHTYCISSSRRRLRSSTMPDWSNEVQTERPSYSPLLHNETNTVECSPNLEPDTILLLNTHHDDVVEHLDVIDPHVGTVSTLTNAANALLIPPLSWYSRKPILVLDDPIQPASVGGVNFEENGEKQLQDSLDRHVDDVLRRPYKLKRTMRGVWSFIKTPMGVVTAIYGFLVVFWGAAIVFFLAKFINFHNANTQGFWIEVSSQTVNGLFTAVGIGLIPYRVLDTYRICWIWYYKRKTKKLRVNAGLPQLFDEDDLPDPMYDPSYVHVLTEREEKFLHRRMPREQEIGPPIDVSLEQRKFRYSQTWYRPHGTETHRAFPINTALVICLLNDGNSVFQIILCGTMWGLDRFQRPAWSTGILIPAGFLCGISAAVFIWRGGQKTKRIAEVRERLRAALADNSHESRPRGGTSREAKQSLQQTEGAALMVDEYMTVPSKEIDEPPATL